MPEHRTRALVLRTFAQGESDRLLHLYTEGLGRVSAIAKGARRSRRRFPGALEILAVLDVRLVDPPRASLMRLEGAVLLRPFEGLVEDLQQFAIACQLLELLDRFTGEREPNAPLFAFVLGVLDVLRQAPADPLLGLLVLIKTLARLGYRPQLVRCALCGKALEPGGPRVAFAPRHGGAVCRACADGSDPRVSAALLAALEAGVRTPLRLRHELGLDAPAVRVAGRLVERFFSFHLGAELRTAAFLRELPGALDGERERRDTPPALAGRDSGERSARVEPGP